MELQKLTLKDIVDRALCEAIHTRPLSESEVQIISQWVELTVTNYRRLERALDGGLVFEILGDEVEVPASHQCFSAGNFEDHGKGLKG